MKSRISTDLKNPRLLKLLKWEAQERDCSMTEVLIRALETYFADRLETQAIGRLSTSVFKEWNDPRDADYDKL